MQEVNKLEEHVKDRSIGENMKRDGGKSREPRNKPREPKDKQRSNDRPPPKKLCDDDRPASRKRGEQGGYERERSRSARGGRGRAGGGNGREFVRGGQQGRGRGGGGGGGVGSGGAGVGGAGVGGGGFGLPPTRGRSGRGRRDHPSHEQRPRYERGATAQRGWETHNHNDVESDHSDADEFEDMRRRTHGDDSDVSLDENSAYVSESSTDKGVPVVHDGAPRGRAGNKPSSRQGGSRNHRGGRDREHTSYSDKVVGQQGFGNRGERRIPGDRMMGDLRKDDDGLQDDSRGGAAGRSNSMGMPPQRGESGHRGRGVYTFFTVFSVLPYFTVILHGIKNGLLIC